MIQPYGRCIHRDDMDILLPKIRDADILVLASPLYGDEVTGPMKTVLDRMVPLLQIFMEIKSNHTRHPLKDAKLRKVILVSTCGFWERDNFDVLVAHIRAFAKNFSAEFAGALLRPHGAALPGMIAWDAPVLDVPDAARESGRRLIKEGAIPGDLLDTISRPLLPRDEYQQDSNRYFQEMLEKAIRLQERSRCKVNADGP